MIITNHESPGATRLKMGNRLMSRLILNAISLPYAGIVASIREHDDAGAEHIGIASKAGEELWGGTELAGLVLRKAGLGLRTMREKLNVATMRISMMATVF